MKVSIAMAVFNGDAYLDQQLDSFLRQSRLPDELVVLDDASSDDSPDIVRAFAERAPFTVKLVVNTQNLGYAQNFGKALSMCGGDLVFLSDQDDVWFESKIETIAALAQDMPDKFCFMNDALLADHQLVPSGMTKCGQILAAGLPETAFVMGCCAAIKRELLEVLLPVPASASSHDNWLINSADELGLVYRSNRVLQLYRRHGSNASNFFVNTNSRLTKPKLWLMGMRQVLRRAVTGNSLDRELAFYQALDARIREKMDLCIGFLGKESSSGKALAIAMHYQALLQRKAIRSLRFFSRVPAVFVLWRAGGYRLTGGCKGMLKDLVLGGAVCAGWRGD